jgi:hypothetical protein
MYRGHEKVMTVGPDDDGVDRLQSVLGQFQIVTDHDDGYLRPHLLDFRGHDRAVQQAQVVLDHNRVDRLRHQKPQAFITTGRGDQPIAVLFQVEQLARIPVYAK